MFDLLSLVQGDVPNQFSVWIEIVKGVVAVATLAITLLITTRAKRQETKIDSVHSLVNGDRAAKEAKIAEQQTEITQLQTQLRKFGYKLEE